jgi:hypothetical protein
MQQRSPLTGTGVITVFLILQIIPLLLFPSASFAPTSQEWWLPALLAIMVIVADVQIMVQRTPNLDPWYLVAFSQGFNIISRLMMIWSHAVITVNKVDTANWPYIILSIVSIVMSIFLLWYTEKPDVRMAFLPK